MAFSGWHQKATTQITKFMGPTWGRTGPCRPQMGPHVGPMNLAIREPTVVTNHYQVQCDTVHSNNYWHIYDIYICIYIYIIIHILSSLPHLHRGLSHNHSHIVQFTSLALGIVATQLKKLPCISLNVSYKHDKSIKIIRQPQQNSAQKWIYFMEIWMFATASMNQVSRIKDALIRTWFPVATFTNMV